MNRIFEMADETNIEAFVIVSDYDRGVELFNQHLETHGGEPDSLLYREWAIEDLVAPERTFVTKASELGLEGLLVSNEVGYWTFLVPLGRSDLPRSEN